MLPDDVLIAARLTRLSQPFADRRGQLIKGLCPDQRQEVDQEKLCRGLAQLVLVHCAVIRSQEGGPQSSGLATLASPTCAQEAATVADLRCIIADNVIAMSATTAREQAFLHSAGLFYLGRIDAREPNLDLGAALAAQLKQLDEQHLAGDVERCRADLEKLSQRSLALAAAFEGAASDLRNKADQPPK